MAELRPTEPASALLQRARRFMPGGTVHTFSHRPPGFPTFMETPDFAIDRAEGPWLWTTEGERLLDVVLGSGCVILGHAHPAIVAAMKAQAARGTNFAHVSRPAIELAEEIVTAIPSAEKVRFFNSGTEAMMHALRIVRAHTGRDRVIKLDGAYHGCLDELLVRTSYGPVTTESGTTLACDSPGTLAAHAERVIVVPYNDLDAMREAAAANRRELAAIIVEPLMRGLGPAPGYLSGVREIADSEGVPLVFDEVITGFRLARGGAQEFYGVDADLTVLGKGLGAGAPMGAVAGSETLMAWLQTGRPDGKRILGEGSSYGNALAAAAALAQMRELARPGTYEHLHGMGRHLADRLGEQFSQHRLVPRFVSAGPVIEFYFGEGPFLDYASAQASDQRVKRALAQGLRSRGVFGGGGRYYVSLAHGEAEIDVLVSAVEDVLRELARN